MEGQLSEWNSDSPDPHSSFGRPGRHEKNIVSRIRGHRSHRAPWTQPEVSPESKMGRHPRAEGTRPGFIAAIAEASRYGGSCSARTSHAVELNVL